jgi:hypothetical protein
MATSLEWDKGGALACAYLGMESEEIGELLDELQDCFHGAD